MQRFRVIDAFTARPFSGNPAAVLLLDHTYDETWAQAVAAEFNLSETAFCRVAEEPETARELRWFTPLAEVALCGHATLATAHALVEEGVRGPYRFQTRSGTLVVTSSADGMLWMDFPAHPPQEAEPPRGLLHAVGAKPRWVGAAGTGDYLLEYADAAAVGALRPDFGALQALVGVRGVIATAASGQGAEHDFVSRFFAPSVGVPEDPVTGSAHTVLAPYWGRRLGRARLRGTQISPRGGEVCVEAPAGNPARVLLGGRALTVSRGEILV